MNNLGMLYMYGQGVPPDHDQARRLFEQGAALGNDATINGLGALYDQGHGVAHDARMARQLFEKAAALGITEACV